MQFKVGDNVRIWSMRWCDKYDGKCGNEGMWAEQARPYVGEAATIVYVNEDAEYYEIDKRMKK